MTMKVRKKGKNFLLIMLLCSIITPVKAGRIGFAAAGYTSPFHGDPDQLLPWPIIDVNTDYVFIKNFSAGVHVWREADQKLDAIIQYLPLHLNPSKNNSEQIKKLDRRRSTVLGGAAYQFFTDFGNIDMSVLGDVLDNSRSLIANVTYTYHAPLNREAVLSPIIGIAWLSKQHSQYYYGVSASESQRTGLEIYRPRDNFSYHIGFDFDYYFNKNWSGHIDYRYFLLKDTVKPSPIIKHDYSHVLLLGISFNF